MLVYTLHNNVKRKEANTGNYYDSDDNDYADYEYYNYYYQLSIRNTSITSHCALALPTFLSDGAEFILQFDVVAGALHAVRQTGHGRLEVHQLGTQVGVGGVQTDGGHAGRQRNLEGGEHGRNTKKKKTVGFNNTPGEC